MWAADFKRLACLGTLILVSGSNASLLISIASGVVEGTCLTRSPWHLTVSSSSPPVALKAAY